MSHPVFLESPPWPRMPEGRKGELPAYYGSGGPSLVANAAIPLLWQAMFGPGDIRYAAVIDDFDPVEGAVELEEFLEDATPSELEATYPYLVASRDGALARLEARRERLIDLIGERYRPVYQAFSDHVRDHYGDYVLVRTSGLPDIEDATGWMTSMLADMEVMEHADAAVPAGLAHEAEELRRAQDADAVWLVSGVGETGSWPSQRLIDAFPACAPRRPVPASDTGAPVRARPIYRADTLLDKVLEWCAVFIFAAVALGVWWKTRSVWLSILAAVAFALVAGWSLARLKRVR
ncbi:MAG: hypothetical protein ABN502_09800 [Gammaproteobacteria bacterium]